MSLWRNKLAGGTSSFQCCISSKLFFFFSLSPTTSSCQHPSGVVPASSLSTVVSCEGKKNTLTQVSTTSTICFCFNSRCWGKITWFLFFNNVKVSMRCCANWEIHYCGSEYKHLRRLKVINNIKKCRFLQGIHWIIHYDVFQSISVTTKG